jgi:hypothetical protein
MTRLSPSVGFADGYNEFLICIGARRLMAPKGAPFLTRLFEHCTQFHPQQRPSMDVIVRDLVLALGLPETPDADNPALFQYEVVPVHTEPAVNLLSSLLFPDDGDHRADLASLSPDARVVFEKMMRRAAINMHRILTASGMTVQELAPDPLQSGQRAGSPAVSISRSQSPLVTSPLSQATSPLDRRASASSGFLQPLEPRVEKSARLSYDSFAAAKSLSPPPE